LRAKLKELASQRRRFGYRRLGLLLARQGIKLNAKKLYRLYKEERLTVRKRGGRKRALGTRAPMAIPQDRNLRWSLDFVADTLVSGRRFRILTLVDDFTRECLGLVVDTSLTGLRVARELDRIAEPRGYPRMIVSDNGTELTSNAVLAWQQEHAANGTTSRRANRCRVASSRASTAGCTTNASTSTCSPTSRRRARSSKNGGSTTTPTDRTRA
jgi:putative transposase